MKPTIRKQKSARGRVTGYAASYGPISTPECATPIEATAQCEKQVDQALARLERGTRVFTWRGHTCVVSPTTAGWQYWTDTFSATDYAVQCGTESREDAENSAYHHLAQNVWTREVADDEAFVEGLPYSVRRQIRSWIAFQRAYAVAQAEGKNSHECHEIGCRASSAFDAERGATFEKERVAS